ncbi:MAG: hypothetical protein GX259_08730 [Bacteroidales bacterium]|jgi:hypothetical protein|nr:hypothetical protein [Bacteroidales bacterium]
MEKISYNIPLEQPGGLSIKDSLNDLIEVKDYFLRNGINASNSRISRYIKYLELLTSGVDVNENEIFRNIPDDRFQSKSDWLVYVVREVHELIWILKGLKCHEPCGLREKLQKINDGRDFAAFDTNSESRNTQFELRIASYFCQSGFNVDVSTLTDVIIESEKYCVYIECKRISSESKLMKNLHNANEQLKSRLPRYHNGKPSYGMIAIDVTGIAYPHQGMVIGITQDHTRDVVKNKIMSIVESIKFDSLFKNNKRLLEIWTNVHIAAIATHPHSFGSRFSFFGNHLPNPDRKEQRVIKDLISARNEATKPDEREMPPMNLEYRDQLTIPAETTYCFDEDLIKDFFVNRNSKKWEITAVACKAKINGKEVGLGLIDLEMAVDKLQLTYQEVLKEWDNIHLKLFAMMLFIKFPYKGSGMDEFDIA